MAAFCVAVVLTAFSSLVVVAGGAGIRLAIALAIALLLITLALTRPAFGVLATFGYLVFVALQRRVLLYAAPWVSADPMLLVAPLVAVVLIVKAFVLDSRPVAPDAISKLVLLVLAMTFAEVANPAGGGIGAGIAGLLFMAVPLLWFFVGREFLPRALDQLMALVVVLGTVVACYGLYQTQVGEPPWDANWLQTPGASGYSSLYIGGAARAFGTFSSSSEYALFVGAAIAAAVAFCLRGRLLAAVPIPLLAVALFLSSGRGPLVTAAFGVIVMLGLSTGRPYPALMVTVAAVGAAFLALHFAAPALSNAGSSSGALVSHQLSGITSPLDPNSSTLLTHLQLVVAGFKSSLSHPLGLGTAVTNNAASVIASNGATSAGSAAVLAVGTGSSATEVDISNAFVAFGVAGIVYLALVVLILVRAVRSYFRGHTELLPIIGILIVAAGQWTIGGDYALASLIWMLIGIVAATSHELTLRRRA